LINFTKNNALDDYCKGRFSLINNNPQAKENYINKNPLLKSAGIFRDWPEDRLIYFNLDDNLLCLINEEDHLKIKLNTSDRTKMTDNLVLYFDLLEKLENNFSFAYDNDIGYLNSLPINSGASTYFNIKIKAPKNPDNFKKIKQALEESEKDLLLDFKDQESSDYSILSISNKTPYYSFANLLIDMIKIKDYLK
jgi:protein-arginine kinase